MIAAGIDLKAGDEVVDNGSRRASEWKRLLVPASGAAWNQVRRSEDSAAASEAGKAPLVDLLVSSVSPLFDPRSVIQRCSDYDRPLSCRVREICWSRCRRNCHGGGRCYTCPARFPCGFGILGCVLSSPQVRTKGCSPRRDGLSLHSRERTSIDFWPDDRYWKIGTIRS